jgi:hypothetical protein
MFSSQVTSRRERQCRVLRSTFLERNLSKTFLFHSLQENRLTKCDSCTDYKKVLESTTNKEKRKEIEDLLQKHIHLVM